MIIKDCFAKCDIAQQAVGNEEDDLDTEFVEVFKEFTETKEIQNEMTAEEYVDFECLAWWLTNCARKPKVPGSSPVASYVKRWAHCSNSPANV